MKFAELCGELEAEIQLSYESGVTLEEAEKLAAKFLQAQMKAATELRFISLDTKMRKAGLKAIRAAAYSEILSKNEKKPTEAAIEHQLNLDPIASGAQEGFDKAEVLEAETERYYNIFREAHIYYRGISKGRFE